MMVVSAVREVGEQNRFKSLKGPGRPATDRFKVRQVSGDLPPVPGRKNVLHILEILVERGTPDASLGGNARHVEGGKALVSGDGRRPIHDRIGHGVAMGGNGVVPEFGHAKG